MTLVQRSTEKPVLNTRLHNRENRLPAVHTSTENDIRGSAKAHAKRVVFEMGVRKARGRRR